MEVRDGEGGQQRAVACLRLLMLPRWGALLLCSGLRD